MSHIFKPNTKEELKKAIENLKNNKNDKGDINTWDVLNMTNMSLNTLIIYDPDDIVLK